MYYINKFYLFLTEVIILFCNLYYDLNLLSGNIILFMRTKCSYSYIIIMIYGFFIYGYLHATRKYWNTLYNIGKLYRVLIICISYTPLIYL